jgi:hypothetical protein
MGEGCGRGSSGSSIALTLPLQNLAGIDDAHRLMCRPTSDRSQVEALAKFPVGSTIEKQAFLRRSNMSLELKEEVGGKVLVVHLAGKLAKSDYVQFGPEVNRLIEQHGKIRILMEMKDFHGWTLGALWEDIKFDAKHFKDIERVAMVGDKKWEEWMAKFCRPFTSAEIHYFDQSQAEQAKAWIMESGR